MHSIKSIDFPMQEDNETDFESGWEQSGGSEERK